jgi:hypothetical protein
MVSFVEEERPTAIKKEMEQDKAVELRTVAYIATGSSKIQNPDLFHQKVLEKVAKAKLKI